MKEVQPNTFNEYTYLGRDAYTAPIVVHNARGVVSYYYLLRDHLGNITHQVNTSNAVVAEYSFDAWGRRRNASNWTYTLDANDKALFADRGFTGHEYLPWYKLYNMNGRMYDPAVGRFLSADPVVQDPGNSQSYNRYSYCLNNPLKYADPSGYIFEQKDLPQDSEQRASAEEFFRKFSSGFNMGFSRQAGTMPPKKLTEEEAKKKLQDTNVKNFIWTSKTGTVQNDEKANEEKGGIWTLGITGTACAGFGASIELGLIMDFRNGYSLGVYFTLEETYGADLSAGAVLNYNIPTNNSTSFNMVDLNGWGESTNGSIWTFDGVYGGNSFKSGLHPDTFSDYHSLYETYGFGVSVGPPLGFSIHKGYTWTTKPLINWKNGNR